MSYTYKIQKYNGEVYFYSSKESLFDLIDEFGMHSFRRQFCDAFDFNAGHIENSVQKICVGGEYYDNEFFKHYDYQPTYRNGNYTIRNIHGQPVCIDDLVWDYAQSRNLVKEKVKKVYNSWSKQKKRPLVVKFMKGVKQEFSQNELDLKEGHVKIRRKRVAHVKTDFYFEGYRRSDSARSWKENKKTKQWM